MTVARGELLRRALACETDADLLNGMMRYARARVSFTREGAAYALGLPLTDVAVLVNTLMFFGRLRFVKDSYSLMEAVRR